METASDIPGPGSWPCVCGSREEFFTCGNNQRSPGPVQITEARISGVGLRYEDFLQLS